MHVSDWMTKKVITVSPDDYLSIPGNLLKGKNLLGIISDSDIFRALVDISEGRHGGHRITVVVNDKPGTIREAADIVRDAGFGLSSIMTSYEGVSKGKRYLNDKN